MVRFFFVLFGLFVAGCTPTDRSSPPSPEGPALWRVSDHDTTVWLLGSVHVLKPGVVWRTGEVRDAFAAADLIVFELDPSDAAADRSRALFDAYGRNPQGVSLTALLSASDQDRLARVAARLGLSLDALEGMRPWLAAQQIALASVLENGARIDLGVDQVLAQEAERLGKPMAFLETPEQQVRILADLPASEELRFFSASLRQAEEEAQTMDEIDAAWARGDVAALEAMVDALAGEAGPAVFEAMITVRNRAFADAVVARLEGDDPTVLVAVGAAHMVGEAGVPALLRARGLPVEGP
jgi:hypothetical protein